MTAESHLRSYSLAPHTRKQAPEIKPGSPAWQFTSRGSFATESDQIRHGGCLKFHADAGEEKDTQRVNSKHRNFTGKYIISEDFLEKEEITDECNALWIQDLKRKKGEEENSQEMRKVKFREFQTSRRKVTSWQMTFWERKVFIIAVDFLKK
ncbi:uncharacterized protein LOC143689500 [Tamandua tetradactyla]|uniref:uncharacterized protein LOC143689500 n=1 Tax=Tamandua tetradactyla TaxID=48850 RepID=UPI004053A73F